MLDRDADELLVLVDVDRRRFAGGADDDDAVGAFGDVPVDQLPKRGEVERAVLVHRRDDRDQAAGDHGADSNAFGTRRSRAQRRWIIAGFGPLARIPARSAIGAQRHAKASSSSPGRSRKAGFDGPAEALVADMKVS